MAPVPRAAEFETFGTSHQVVLLLAVAGAVALAVAGRRTRERDDGDRLGKALAVALLGAVVPLQVVYFTPAYYDVDVTLPLQLSDLAAFTAAYALWTHRRWAVGLTYYWGLVLTPQAVLTPDLSSTFPSPVFLLFWIMHVGTVWAAVHLTWGRGLAPGWDTYRRTIAVTAAWAVAVYCFNLAAGTNYGYLNAKPGGASVLDLFGPWPWYVAVEVVVLCTVWALMTWPWVRARRTRPEYAAP